jgi:hypothetical protein
MTAPFRKRQTIGGYVKELLSREGRPLTVDQILAKVHKRFPESHTSRESVAWYMSKMRRVDGREPNVKRRASGRVAVH